MNIAKWQTIKMQQALLPCFNRWQYHNGNPGNGISYKHKTCSFEYLNCVNQPLFPRGYMLHRYFITAPSCKEYSSHFTSYTTQ